MSKKGVFEEGDEIDFDQLNEQRLTNLTTYETIKAVNVYTKRSSFTFK